MGVVTCRPIIAVGQGYCVVCAFILVQLCDLVVAADDTIFKYPEAQVGFTGGLIAGCAARIPHKIAMEFMLLGQDLPAQRAYDVGMVNNVVPLGEQMDAAMEYANILKISAPLVVDTIKGLVAATVHLGPADLSAIARDKLLVVNDITERAEGRRSF